jgi:hypothetical protein
LWLRREGRRPLPPLPGHPPPPSGGGEGSVRGGRRGNAGHPPPRGGGWGEGKCRAKAKPLIDGQPQVMNTPSWRNFVADQVVKKSCQCLGHSAQKRNAPWEDRSGFAGPEKKTPGLARGNGRAGETSVSGVTIDERFVGSGPARKLGSAAVYMDTWSSIAALRPGASSVEV